MAWEEFVYWQAFLSLEPIQEPANQRTAMLLSQITNMSGKSLRDGKTVTPDDFLGKKTKPQSLEQQIEFFKSLSKEKA